MDKKLASAKKEVLVEIVKLSQKRGMKGSEGDWKEFLSVYDKKFGASMSDPSRRSPDQLLAFLKTFSSGEDFKFFEKVIQCHSNREVVAQSKQNSPDNESPEQRLVRLTLGHPLYPVDYSFPSHEEEWMVMKLSKKLKHRRSTEMVAIDCEMVLCEDGTEALVNVCVVDCNLKVKLNELVNPNKAVADYRTEITGITAKDLEGITCSLVDIQKSLKKLLSHGTILVGHSLNNDLQALKIDHARVIDTSLVLKLPDQSNFRRPSLNNLCKSVLGHEVRKEGAPHNCLDDARAAMKLVLAKIGRRFDDDISLADKDVPDTAGVKLLLHRIPVTVPNEELHKIFPGKFTIEPQTNKRARKVNYSALAIFDSPEEAHQAFENVVGDHGKDSSGRPRKLISFQLSTGETASIYVCEMTLSNPIGEISSKKRPLQLDEASHESKKVKTDQNIGKPMETTVDLNLCEDHVNEIERLKQLVKERDDEISALHRIVASLARKQGL